MFGGRYVLLVGGGEGGAAVGRSFLVAKVRLALSDRKRYLKIQTFSSELGAWELTTKIRTPQIRGRYLPAKNLGTPMVVGSSAHFLCQTNAASYVIELHVRTARVTVTALPESFPRPTWWDGQSPRRHLLATATASGSPIVLVADDDKVSVWAQSKQTSRWEQQPQVVAIHRDAMVRFKGGSAHGEVSAGGAIQA
ncbi:hypothetical protein PVAP13_2KG574300 [Panicum virgatum]|uniref:DUF7595 domain-containing protein n=1 Tax=Panicum virgatum TaxID=38727 RepID=A0A8T0WJN3_PANVG|nr:hypothetical protein PVAP13_2KG574300 [Panicum virgatum]